MKLEKNGTLMRMQIRKNKMKKGRRRNYLQILDGGIYQMDITFTVDLLQPQHLKVNQTSSLANSTIFIMLISLRVLLTLVLFVENTLLQLLLNQRRMVSKSISNTDIIILRTQTPLDMTILILNGDMKGVVTMIKHFHLTKILLISQYTTWMQTRVAEGYPCSWR